MAAGGGEDPASRKDNEGEKFSVKRFAYDVLKLSLLKCGLPESLLTATIDEENVYSRHDFVLTVYAGIIAIALHSRGEWKRTFEQIRNVSGLKDMQEIEEFLSEVVLTPEFQNTDDLNKIRKSFALYSELILFSHYNNITVDFDRLLDLWSSYFSEKISGKQDARAFLEAIFIEDSFIISYVKLVDNLVREIAVPYGWRDDVSEEFQEFSVSLEKFNENPENSIEDVAKSMQQSRFKHWPIDVLGTIEEETSYFSDILESDSEPPDNRSSSTPLEHPPNFSLPSWSTSRVEESFEGLNIGNEEASQESDVETPTCEKLQ